MFEIIGLTLFVLLGVLVSGGFALYPLVWLLQPLWRPGTELDEKGDPLVWTKTPEHHSLYRHHGIHVPA